MEIFVYFLLAIGGGILAAVLAILSVFAMVVVAALITVYLPKTVSIFRARFKKSEPLHRREELSSSRWSSETA